MKTIVIIITRGSLAFSLLENDFYKILREKYRIIILTPAWEDKRFVESFKHRNVELLPFVEKKRTTFERMLTYLHNNLIYNSTTDHRARWGVIGDPNSPRPSHLRYLIVKSVFIFLSKIKWLREVVRFIDWSFTQKEEVSDFVAWLKVKQPSCVISTFVGGDSEMALIKAAKKLKIPTIGYWKTWDNLSMYGLRTKPDMTVVWNEFSREQVLRFQNMKDKDIHIIGVPQFDSNFDEKFFMSREEFCQLYGLDPSRKIILHCSSGKLFPTDVTIAELLVDHIKENKFPYSSQLLIRPHYGYVDDDEKFANVKGKPGVVIDLFNNPSNLLRDRWDYSIDFKKRFINTLRYADVVVNTSSTITLDALCYDKPVILIAFDGKEKMPYKESVERWYETLYYRKIISYGATKYAKSELELIDGITSYLQNPQLNGEARERLRSDFTYKLDGGAGRRFAAIVEEVVSSK